MDTFLRNSLSSDDVMPRMIEVSTSGITTILIMERNRLPGRAIHGAICSESLSESNPAPVGASRIPRSTPRTMATMT
jgi:hypothetical protein